MVPTTAERTAGVSTATGTVTYGVTEDKMIYTGDTTGWSDVTSSVLDASGGTEFNAANGKEDMHSLQMVTLQLILVIII